MVSLADWLVRTINYPARPEELAPLRRERIGRQADQRGRRSFPARKSGGWSGSWCCRILDTAWKEHLLAMDHLRHSVGLRGYAQVDPKVEYKREGMRIYEQMWISVDEQVTDLVFRMEQLDEDFVGSTWVEAEAIHEARRPRAGSIAAEQQQAIEDTESDRKPEPIRNMSERVGRNDPCPCGSGKKFKNCHMRKERAGKLGCVLTHQMDDARAMIMVRQDAPYGPEICRSRRQRSADHAAGPGCRLSAAAGGHLALAPLAKPAHRQVSPGAGGQIPRPGPPPHLRQALRLAARRQCGRGESAGRAGGRNRPLWPDWECVVSTTTRSGYGLAQARFPQLSVFYCPLDFSWAVRRAMRTHPATNAGAGRIGIVAQPDPRRPASGRRVAVINGRLSERSFRGYRRISPAGGSDAAATRPGRRPDFGICRAVSGPGASRQAVRITGSIKFDGAESDRGNAQTTRLAELAGIGLDDVVFLAGSTQEPEEQLALETYRRCVARFPRLKLILVPRHPERFDRVAQMLADSGIAWCRRSQLDAQPQRGQPGAGVLLVDRIGELRAWWGTAKIAFVGGSLTPRGGQNMIEPAAYGAAVSFGPATHNFRDVVALMLRPARPPWSATATS